MLKSACAGVRDPHACAGTLPKESTMKKLCVIFAFLAGCHGQLPSFDDVLQRLREGLDTANQVEQGLEKVHALVCAPEVVPAHAVDECAEAAEGLEVARRSTRAAEAALSAAEADAGTDAH